jgi:hypothetical protein
LFTFTGSQLYQFSYNCGFGQLIAAFTHWLQSEIVFIGQLSVPVSYMRLSWVSSVLAFRPPWWFFFWVSCVMMRYSLSFSSFSLYHFHLSQISEMKSFIVGEIHIHDSQNAWLRGTISWILKQQDC